MRAVCCGVQSLISLGYTDSARSVETESGVVLQSDAVSQFRALILRGAWAEAHAMLSGYSPRSADT
jgi:hypothetical protein